MVHRIEVFKGTCNLFNKVVGIVTLGKCVSCKIDVINVNSEDMEAKKKMQMYAITAVPSIAVDGRTKVVGIPQFPWFCGDDFYTFLEEKYPLNKK